MSKLPAFGSPTARVKPHKGRAVTERQREKLFRPYALEIGKLALAWNRLQEHLALLFSTALGSGDTILLAYRVWHSSQSDRAQREMLRAAAEVTFDKEEPPWPRALQDTLWLLDKAQSLADQRNDALHSPFILGHSATAVSVRPASFLGHPRARKLQGKDVLAELKWYTQRARILGAFAYGMFYALKIAPMMHQPHAWPDRPQLPPLGQSKTRKTKHPRKRARPRPRQR